MNTHESIPAYTDSITRVWQMRAYDPAGNLWEIMEQSGPIAAQHYHRYRELLREGVLGRVDFVRGNVHDMELFHTMHAPQLVSVK